MDRKKEICDLVKKYSEQNIVSGEFGEIGITADDIADMLMIDRSGVSRLLNALVKDGELAKIEGRPKRFISSEKYNEIFENSIDEKQGEEDPYFGNLIGWNESLKDIIEQVKAAMMYPPKGLHTLLVGPTGVGKSLMAERMYQFAREKGQRLPNGKLVVFNCAEYAENPQLLLAHIFGYVKGAYTGALKDSGGLVDEADGGVLFLDEIHRLPKEGQEILFTLIDKGTFRRLGENEKEHKADVLLIGATTEKLDDYMAKTFLRRIPVVVKIPGLEERSASERLALIESFFYTEQQSVGVSFKIHRDVIKILALYQCEGNIGQLKADIKIICANGFLKYKMEKASYVTIQVTDLPEKLVYSRLNRNKNAMQLIEFTAGLDEYIYCSGSADKSDMNLKKAFQMFRTNYCKPQNPMEKQISDYLNNIQLEEISNDYADIRKRVRSLVDEHVYEATETTLKYIEYMIGRNLSNRVRVGYIIHVNLMVDRIRNHEAVPIEVTEDMRIRFPENFKTARIAIKMLEEELELTIPAQEVNFLLHLISSDQLLFSGNIGVVVVAHGDSTAKSMLDVAQKMLSVSRGKAVDMPLEKSADKVMEEIIDAVKKEDSGRGVLLLADMGSLTQMEEIVQKRTGSQVYTIKMVSTLTVLEALRRVENSDLSVKELGWSIAYSAQNVYRESRDEINSEKKIILVTCITGKGAAEKIKGMLENELEGLDVCILTTNKNKFQEKLQMGRIVAVVGTEALPIPDVPYISIDEFIMGDGASRIREIIGLDEGKLNPEKNQKKTYIDILNKLVNFLDANKLYPLLMKAYMEITEKTGKNCDTALEMRFLVHAAYMVERAIRGEVLPYCDNEDALVKNPELCLIIRNAMEELCQAYSIMFCDEEIAYLIELFL